MNNRSDPALMLSTNSEEEIVNAQSKNRAHEQAHWRATISSQLQKHEHSPPARSSGSPRGAVCS